MVKFQKVCGRQADGDYMGTRRLWWHVVFHRTPLSYQEDSENVIVDIVVVADV